MIHLATGLIVRDERLLMVASRYANHAQPLWNLPGGRQLPGELLAETAEREILEETGLHARAGEVAYLSESYDGDVHYLNVTFHAAIATPGARPATPALRASAQDDKKGGGGADDHVVEVAWVPLDEVAQRVVVGVVREPLVAYLRGDLPRRYAGYHEAGVTIEWPPDSR